jgi:hypothetical protein
MQNTSDHVGTRLRRSILHYLIAGIRYFIVGGAVATAIPWVVALSGGPPMDLPDAPFVFQSAHGSIHCTRIPAPVGVICYTVEGPVPVNSMDLAIFGRNPTPEKAPSSRLPDWARVPSKIGHRATTYIAGFPFTSYIGYEEAHDFVVECHGVVHIYWWSVGEVCMPLKVLWIGMIANGAVMGALMWGLTYVFRHGRRAWRRYHNRCENCGYDLTGLQNRVCSECGAYVSVPSTSAACLTQLFGTSDGERRR